MSKESKPSESESKFKCTCGWLKRVIEFVEKNKDVISVSLDPVGYREQEARQKENKEGK